MAAGARFADSTISGSATESTPAGRLSRARVGAVRRVGVHRRREGDTHRTDLTFSDLEHDYGFSISVMRGPNTVARTDFAFGSGEGTKIVVSFGLIDNVKPERLLAIWPHARMGRRVPLLVVSLVMTTACALNNRPTLSPTKMAEFWQEPADTAQRDLFNGGGGAAHAPKPNATFTLIASDRAASARGST